ncbi:hypothetical protein [Streptomyces aureoverticillatus]|nr:hypothetical protein [Streptomyces aureoverticillatus]QIB49495.1 hypothetical protein G3H79_40705 [Streptomyces aureoverticillatus]
MVHVISRAAHSTVRFLILGWTCQGGDGGCGAKNPENAGACGNCGRSWS